MRLAPWTYAPIALVFAFSLASPLAIAQPLQTPTPAESSQSRPARGMSMEKVEASFGAPANRAQPVGQPPITRWEYPGFVVYFENSIVLHTVVTG